MSGLDELNKIIRNSKIIPEKQKQEYELKTMSDIYIMDYFNNNIFKEKTNEQTNNKK